MSSFTKFVDRNFSTQTVCMLHNAHFLNCLADIFEFRNSGKTNWEILIHKLEKHRLTKYVSWCENKPNELNLHCLFKDNIFGQQVQIYNELQAVVYSSIDSLRRKTWKKKENGGGREGTAAGTAAAQDNNSGINPNIKYAKWLIRNLAAGVSCHVTGRSVEVL